MFFIKNLFIHKRLLGTRRNAWLVAVGFAFYILLSAPWIQNFSRWLRSHNLLRITLCLLFAAVLLYLLIYFITQVRLQAKAYITFALVITFGFLLMRGLYSLEEKLHFLEYALLALFFFKALKFHFHDFRRYLFAILLASATGLADELWQGLLPNRVCDPWDIYYNFAGGTLGILMAWIRQRYGTHG